jgi:CARDB protein
VNVTSHATRLGAIALVFALLAVAAGGSFAAGTKKVPARAASVKVVECVSGDTAEQRSAVFRGAMRRLKGTDRMGMRYTLQEKSGNGSYKRLKAPGLGKWRKSRSGVRRFAYRQRVLALGEGSAYRTVVQYRWYSEAGTVVRRATRRSAACKQPGELANLRVQRVGGRVVDGAPGSFRYAISVINRGMVASTATRVRLKVDGREVGSVPVGALAPDQLRRVFVVGPRCTSRTKAQVDPDDTVRESNERDNSTIGACP